MKNESYEGFIMKLLKALFKKNFSNLGMKEKY